MQRPEEQLQRAVAHYLHILEVQGHLTFFATTNQRGTRKRFEMGILKAMGVRAGVGDLCVMWRGGRVGFLELKAEGGKLSPHQEHFRDLCGQFWIPYAVCRSLDDVTETLAEWGVIRSQPLFKGAAA